jgi:CRP-like cAMP-binding protein
MSKFLWQNIFDKDEPLSLMEVLGKVPIFDELNRHQLKAIERILHRRTYAPGEYIFREGETGMGMYIVEKGEVSVVYGSSSVEMAHLGPGEFFGEIALLTEAPRTASARAINDVSVLGFFQPDLFSLLETRPHIGVSVLLKLARIVAERMQEAVKDNLQLIAGRDASNNVR